MMNTSQAFLLAAALGLLIAAPPLSAAGTADALTAYRGGDYAQALPGLQQAAHGGDAQAQYSLGMMYRYGLAVPRDPQRAAELLRQAAAQGDAKAAFELGNMLYFGDGVAQDRALGEAWLKAAREHGVPRPAPRSFGPP